MTHRSRFEKGLEGSQIRACFRAGRLDGWSTAPTGGSSTRRIKQIAGKQRRAHHKRETREAIQDS